MDESKLACRNFHSLANAFLWALLPTLALLLISPAVGDGQVATNITPTTTAPLDLGTNVDTVGSTTQITGGTRPGSSTNLFHSFDSFTLGTGDTAHFLNDMQLPTNNIFGRVIGGEVSEIDGTLRTNNPLDTTDPMNFGAANLWLVNPSGLLLGPNARIEVGGSVSMSTANYLRFEGQPALFDMLASPASLDPLSVAPVVAFGFLSLELPAPITVQGSALSVLPGQSISLVGGKVVIQGDTLPDGTVQQSAHLSVPMGTILLASAASPGEFDLVTLQPLPNVDNTAFASFGSVSLLPGSSIDVSGAGTVFVKGGQLVLSVNDATLSTSESLAPSDTVSLSPGSSIVTSNSGAELGADVQMTVGTLQMDGALVATFNTGEGDGGNISINATTVGLTNGAAVVSFTGLDFITGEVGSGDGGNVMVQGLPGADSGAANSVALINGSAIATLTFGPGRGGDLQLTAGTMTMENAASISTTTADGDGVGGDMVLNVRTLSLIGGSSIESQSTASTPGLGQGGNVTIQGLPGSSFRAAETVALSGDSRLSSQTFGSGNGGRVAITSKSLTMDGAATTVDTSTQADGRGGDILVSVQQASLSGGATIASHTVSAGSDAAAGGTVTVQGLGEPRADSVALSGFGSGIVSATSGTARSGDIAVHAKTVRLTDGAVTNTGCPSCIGTAGNVTIDADSVDISGGSRIMSLSGGGEAGQVAITANALTLDNVSIETNTSNVGRGGDVVLDVRTVSISNGATINSSTFEAGRAGDITMNVGTLSLTGGAQISSASLDTATGSAGSVTIQGLASPADAVTLANSSLLTSADSTGRGGSITVNATNLTLNNATISASVKDVPAGGDPKAGVGNIALSASAMTMNGSDVTTESSGSRNAGDISINSKPVPGNTFEMMQKSTINTSAALSDGGNIGIYAKNMVRLTDSIITSSVGNETETDTLGGNVTIDPQFVILQNSQIRANAFAGSGGAIDITATSAYIKDPASIVSASSTLGISGTINIQSPLQNVGGRLTPLSQQFSTAAALLAQRCAARVADGKFSTFVVAGREGLPAEPGGFLVSPSLTAELLGSSLSGRGPHTQFPSVTGVFPEHDARPIQLAKFGNACH